MNYLLHIAVMMNIYIILALGLNLLVGFTGLLSVCQAAFYGVGAYLTALLMVDLGMSFFPAVTIAIAVSMLFSLTISLPSLRLRGDYFILATLGFQVITFSVLYNWVAVTHGPYGIPGIPRPVVLGFQISTLPNYVILSLVCVFLVALMIWFLVSSPYGRVLKAIREDEVAALSLGKNVTFFKVSAFAVASGMAALAGALYASYVTYIDPTSFTIDESILILSMIIVGGLGTMYGPLVGVTILILIPEALRFAGIPDTVAPNVRQMIYGSLLILMMRFRPQGIAGDYKFE